VQNIYFYERLMELDEQERAHQRQHAQQLREAGHVDRAPRAWLTIVAALLTFLRLG
jgi:hypothetical protein